jgi:hypothetical protein
MRLADTDKEKSQDIKEILSSPLFCVNLRCFFLIIRHTQDALTNLGNLYKMLNK